ncbi:MAG: peptide chain release factor N(5)-glutamine methyltransferase [Clostridia bacterium]|nr:peptide chain release factor N(5)-glutamine methyltransferase [Clostridia bacterium]
MTYRELCARLSDAGIGSAEWDAALLLEHFCGADAGSVALEDARDYVCAELEDAVCKRVTRIPLQYLLGEWEFYRQKYEVTPDCLIPRADTEILVEQAIRRLPHGARFADLCAGSGCIAISVLAERPDTYAIAVEKYPATLELACRNARKNGVEERFVPRCADVLDADFHAFEEPLDAILCNPPYIRSDVIPTLEAELFAEPRAALDGGEDGLLFYRRLLQTQTRCLKPGGFFLFEIGYDQADAVCAIGAENGFAHVEVLRDYGGCDRVAVLSR